MKKYFIPLSIIVLATVLFSFSTSTLKHGDEIPNGPTGKTLQYNSKLIFLMTTPVNDYTVIDKAKPDDKSNTMTAQVLTVTDDMIKKEAKGKMDHFDAVIVYGQYKNMEFVKFNNGKGSTAENSMAYPYIYDTKKNGTKYVYFGLYPDKSYNTLESFDKSAIGQTGIGVSNSTGDPYVVMISSFCEKAQKIAKDKSYDFDGIIVQQNSELTTDVVLGNDFGKDVKIIKFK